jgi:hypothetical protein
MLRLRERVVGITETERASLPLYEMAVLRTSDVESGAERLVNTRRQGRSNPAMPACGTRRSYETRGLSCEEKFENLNSVECSTFAKVVIAHKKR